jgi:hypothetical protein
MGNSCSTRRGVEKLIHFSSKSTRKGSFIRAGVDGRVTLKWIVWGRLDQSGSGRGPLAVRCEHDYDPSHWVGTFLASQ